MNAKTLQLRIDANADRNEVRELFRKTREAVTAKLEKLKHKALPQPSVSRPSRNGLKAVK